MVGELVKEAGYKKPMLVFDAGVKAVGIVDKVLAGLEKAGLEAVCFDKVKPDPSADIVDEGGALCIAEGCDCLIAVGGGSSIDTAKGINILRCNGADSILKFAEPGVPMLKSPGLICVPTTSGTGSELSDGLIITDPESGRKVPILALNGMSEYALLDPELTLGLPPRMTAITGLDVFSHAFESYTTVRANAISDPVSEKILETVIRWLPVAVKDGGNVVAREKMLVSASQGGWMLANSGSHVGHSIAHVIGSAFHLPHGLACAMDLPATIRFIAEERADKVKYLGELLGLSFSGEESPKEVADKTADAYAAFRDSILEVPAPGSYLKDLSEEELKKLAHAVTLEPFSGLCPRAVTEEAALELLKQVL